MKGRNEYQALIGAYCRKGSRERLNHNEKPEKFVEKMVGMQTCANRWQMFLRIPNEDG